MKNPADGWRRERDFLLQGRADYAVGGT